MSINLLLLDVQVRFDGSGGEVAARSSTERKEETRTDRSFGLQASLNEIQTTTLISSYRKHSLRSARHWSTSSNRRSRASLLEDRIVRPVSFRRVLFFPPLPSLSFPQADSRFASSLLNRCPGRLHVLLFNRSPPHLHSTLPPFPHLASPLRILLCSSSALPLHPQ